MSEKQSARSPRQTHGGQSARPTISITYQTRSRTRGTSFVTVHYERSWNDTNMQRDVSCMMYEAPHINALNLSMANVRLATSASSFSSCQARQRCFLLLTSAADISTYPLLVL